MQYAAPIQKAAFKKKSTNAAVALVEELAGSVPMPKEWQGRDIDEIIEEAKNEHFNKKYAHLRAK